MVTKKKDSPELFEVFKTSLRDRLKPATDVKREPPPAAAPPPAPAAHPEAEASTPPAAPVATLPRPEWHEAPASPQPSIFAEAAELGDRVFPLRYNTAWLLLLVILSLVFVSYALGVEMGKDRAWREAKAAAAATGAMAPGPAQPSLPAVRPPATRPPVSPAAQTPISRPPDTHVPDARPPAAPHVPPAVQPRPTEFWTVRIIDYPNDAEGDGSAKSKIAWLNGKGVKAFKTVIFIRGSNNIAVCSGRFESDQDPEAEKLMERVRSLMSAFKYCNLVKVAEER